MWVDLRGLPVAGLAIAAALFATTFVLVTALPTLFRFDDARILLLWMSGVSAAGLLGTGGDPIRLVRGRPPRQDPAEPREPRQWTAAVVWRSRVACLVAAEIVAASVLIRGFWSA